MYHFFSHSIRTASPWKLLSNVLCKMYSLDVHYSDPPACSLFGMFGLLPLRAAPAGLPPPELSNATRSTVRYDTYLSDRHFIATVHCYRTSLRRLRQVAYNRQATDKSFKPRQHCGQLKQKTTCWPRQKPEAAITTPNTQERHIYSY